MSSPWMDPLLIPAGVSRAIFPPYRDDGLGLTEVVKVVPSADGLALAAAGEPHHGMPAG